MLNDDKPRATGISYRLANGKSDEITDPAALIRFYTRIYYADQIKSKRTPRTRKTVQDRQR